MKQHLHIKWKANTEQTFVLNLDEKFNPFHGNDGYFFLKFDTFNFLGGEPHFKINTLEIGDIENKRLIITQRADTVQDFFLIVLAADAARRLGFEDIKLILPYFPAARQDRVCNVGEPLTVKVYADIVNRCKFSSVFILSPHSEVAPALLDNVVVMDELPYTEAVIDDLLIQNPTIQEFNIVCPDAGAGKRVEKITKHLVTTFKNLKFNLIRCEKVRDVSDGSLKDFFVQADNLNNHPTIIFDDILCMGGTFVGLGEKLIERDCGKLYLFTVHADCQAGIEKMTDYFDMYFTTNSRRAATGTYDDYKMFEIKL